MKTLVELQSEMMRLGIHNLRVRQIAFTHWKAECEVDHFSQWFDANETSLSLVLNKLIANVSATRKSVQDQIKGSSNV